MEDALTTVARRLGRGVREVRDALELDPSPSPPVHPAELPSALAVIRTALDNPDVRARVGFVDSLVEIATEPEGERVVLDLRRDTGADDAPWLRILLAADVPATVWLGAEQEVALILTGRLAVRGPLHVAVRAIPALREVGHAVDYAEPGAGEPAPRFDYLSLFRDRLAELDPAPVPRELDGSSDAQAALAAAVLVGLPDACRSVELVRLFQANRAGRVTDEQVLALIQALERLATTTLAQVPGGMSRRHDDAA